MEMEMVVAVAGWQVGLKMQSVANQKQNANWAKSENCALIKFISERIPRIIRDAQLM